MIRGHTGTNLFSGDGFDVIPQKLANKPGTPSRGGEVEGTEHVIVHFPRDDTRALWNHFIECIRSCNPETLCPAEIGCAAIATVNMGVRSCREGKALCFDQETGTASEADASWANRWERMGRERAEPHQVLGWTAGTTGSLLEPPDYQALEGDWDGDKDPAGTS